MYQLERSFFFNIQNVLCKDLDKVFDKRQPVVDVMRVSSCFDCALQLRAIDEIHLYLERFWRQERVVDEPLERILRLSICLVRQLFNVFVQIL